MANIDASSLLSHLDSLGIDSLSPQDYFVFSCKAQKDRVHVYVPPENTIRDFFFFEEKISPYALLLPSSLEIMKLIISSMTRSHSLPPLRSCLNPFEVTIVRHHSSAVNAGLHTQPCPIP
ncbi:hypothetical protein VNO77_41666 [Canavalia gladiata]|uniref:Uncharacterized protein n=1 Tax=Canavalia gladiata TaxID=3824 RepID=A0AAN9PS68_CANGL